LTSIRRLYIVEDDDSTRRALVRWARVGGYEVHAFDCAEAFLTSDFALVGACLILDIGLPDCSGAELKRRLIATGRDLPTVFISGFTDAEVARALEGLDAPRVLHKPFDNAELIAAIAAAS
jgi:FixJ family two-component response regulator